MVKEFKYYLTGSAESSRRLYKYGPITKKPGELIEHWYVSHYFPDVRSLEATVIVDKKYANPEFMEQCRSDIDPWQEVAYQIYTDGWNPHDECLWRNTPRTPFTYGDGVKVCFGYCRTQSSKFPDHPLYFIERKPGVAVIVDKACTEPTFMNAMGSDWEQWMMISWAHIISDGDINHNEWSLDRTPLPPDINRYLNNRRR